MEYQEWKKDFENVLKQNLKYFCCNFKCNSVKLELNYNLNRDDINIKKIIKENI